MMPEEPATVSRRDLLSLIGAVSGSAAMYHAMTSLGFAAESGYTEDAVRAKIERGVWLQGDVWFRAPDNRLLIDIEAFYAWAEKNRGPVPQAIRRSKSTSVAASSDPESA